MSMLATTSAYPATQVGSVFSQAGTGLAFQAPWLSKQHFLSLKQPNALRSTSCHRRPCREGASLITSSLRPEDRYSALDLAGLNNPSSLRKSKAATKAASTAIPIDYAAPKPFGLPRPEMFLLAVALSGMFLVVDGAQHDYLQNALSSAFHGDFQLALGAVQNVCGSIKAAFMHNFLQSFFCFWIGDVSAQFIEQKTESRRTGFDTERALKAGLLGILINGIGYELWMGNLDHVLPADGALSANLWKELAQKTFLDSLVWGFCSNSVNVVGRRALNGAPLPSALQAWQSQIVGITIDEFRFWLLWSGSNFLLVPHPLRVNFAALGALIWNVYMSAVANSQIQPSSAVDYPAAEHEEDGAETPQSA